MFLALSRSFRFLILFAFTFLVLSPILSADDTNSGTNVSSASPAVTSLEDRVKDLEAYIGNATPAKLTGVPGPGHNGFMMIASALVLLMTLPGLALFYGGLVRVKNVLSVLAQCLGIAGVVTILWWAFGYSLVFGKSFNSPFFGGSEYFFLKGVLGAPNTDYSAWTSQNVFSMFQLMFAIITPALIVGAVAERMKFFSVLIFTAVWMFVVYFPLAHMVWGITGLMNGVWNDKASIKAIDFAGGTVVHMSSGFSALVLAILLGKRKGYGQMILPANSIVLCMIGTGLLWFGWYGFNAGSSLAADGIAGNAFMTTTLCAAVASFSWALLEFLTKSKTSVLGFCVGAVAGLVVITPACGFVSPTSAVIMGVLAAIVPFIAVTVVKQIFKYDDSLDVFGVHGVGGMLGAFLTGIFATPAVNGNLNTFLSAIVGKTLYLEQLKAIALTMSLSVVATIIIGLLVKFTIGLRIDSKAEEEGLDSSEHGEHSTL
jgi:Amt family ammonium transporter